MIVFIGTIIIFAISLYLKQTIECICGVLLFAEYYLCYFKTDQLKKRNRPAFNITNFICDLLVNSFMYVAIVIAVIVYFFSLPNHYVWVYCIFNAIYNIDIVLNKYDLTNKENNESKS